MIRLNKVVLVVVLILSLLPFVIPFVSAWRNPDSEYSANTTSTYTMTEDVTTLSIGSEANAFNYILRNFNFGGSDTQLSEPAHQINRMLHILLGNPSEASGTATVCALAVYFQYLCILWIAWIVFSVVTLPVRIFTGGVRS